MLATMTPAISEYNIILWDDDVSIGSFNFNVHLLPLLRKDLFEDAHEVFWWHLLLDHVLPQELLRTVRCTHSAELYVSAHTILSLARIVNTCSFPS